MKGCEKCVLQATWIYKLGDQNLENFDCHLGRELVPQNRISKLNHELLDYGPWENLDWIELFLYKPVWRAAVGRLYFSWDFVKVINFIPLAIAL